MFCLRDLGICCRRRRIGAVEHLPSLIEYLLGDPTVLQQGFRALHLLAGKRRQRLLLVDIGTGLVERPLGLTHLCARLLERLLQVPSIHPGHHLTGFHHIAFIRQQFHNAAGELGVDVDLVGLDASVAERDSRRQLAMVLLPPVGSSDHGHDGDDQSGCHPHHTKAVEPGLPIGRRRRSQMRGLLPARTGRQPLRCDIMKWRRSGRLSSGVRHSHSRPCASAPSRKTCGAVAAQYAICRLRMTTLSLTARTPGMLSAATRSACFSSFDSVRPQMSTMPSFTVTLMSDVWAQGCAFRCDMIRSRSLLSAIEISTSLRSVARAWMRFARLTMPTSAPFSTIGTRLIAFFSSKLAMSLSGASGAAVITDFVITSATLRPCAFTYSAASLSSSENSAESHRERRRSVPRSARRIRSLSLTTPTTFPAPSTTGSALMWWWSRSCAASFTDEVGLTVMTGETITSRAFM